MSVSSLILLILFVFFIVKIVQKIRNSIKQSSRNDAMNDFEEVKEYYKTNDTNLQNKNNEQTREAPKINSPVDSYNSGCQKAENQDWRGALGDYNSVIYSNEYVPKDVEISTYLNRGIAYYYVGSPSAAIEDWKKVIELASDNPEKRAKARNLIETVNRERRGY